MIRISAEQCVGCGLCVKDCVFGNIVVKQGKAKVLGACKLCGHCLAVCPQSAVEIEDYSMDEVVPYDRNTFSVSSENLLNMIRFRRSIRQFDSRPISEESLNRIIQAGRYTETAVNSQDVRFIIVREGLEELKNMIWQGFYRYAQSLETTSPEKAQIYKNYCQTYRENPQKDRLFFDAPVFVVVASDYPLDGGLASANMELVANAEGVGVLFDGLAQHGILMSSDAQEWLEIGEKQICSCMLLGYPKVKYFRTVPRKEADVIWK